jgi:sugar phosphate isomerase/epimerase
MKLGTQPAIDQTPRRAFEFARELGFNHIELLMDHPLYAMENLSPAEVLELKESYDLEVLLHAPATSTNFLSVSSVMRKASYEELKRTLRFAEKCEAELITFHLGWNPGFITAKGFVFPKELYVEHNYRVITTELYEFLKSVDAEMLALENTIPLDESLSRAVEFLIENTDLSLTFDVGHYFCKSGHEVFLKHFDRVRNIHLHDNDTSADLHLALGEGKVDLSIIPTNYRHYFTIEVRDEKAIVKSKDWFQRNFLGIKRIG